MKYISTKDAAEKWNISDRRVRILCKEGKIPGVILEGKSYRIPENATKPVDGRYSVPDSFLYLKWEDEIIGIIDVQYNVRFLYPGFNEVVSVYTCGRSTWSHDEFVSFLAERVVSRDRRDIERILFRCGLSNYDVIRISEVTRGIHPKDLLWIAKSKDERFAEVMTAVFQSVFLQKIDLVGDSVDTPEGYNIKRYGCYNGKYGIFKQRISPLVTDVESEAAVYELGKLLGVPCCPAYKVTDDTVFSEFLYDFSKEYIVHFRRLFDGPRGDNEYKNLIEVRPQFRNDIVRMLVLDFITRQDDRHLSNIAIKISGKGEVFYPLYDNGRSLFYEDTPETVKKACKDTAGYATNFGMSGTYLDHLKYIAAEGINLQSLVNLEISDSEISAVLKKSGFRDYRLAGAEKWIRNTIEMVKGI